MVYVTGDTHTPDSFDKLYFSESKNLSKEDFVIVLGDFELLWSDIDGAEWIEKLDAMPYTTLFIDGNFDNFDKLNALQAANKFGGQVGVLSNSVFWLKRGEIYELDGHSYLAAGGASSVTKDGRIEGRNWWACEELSDDDKEHILSNAENYGGSVDFIISHTCPTSILGAIKEYAQKDSVSEFLEELFYGVGFNRWYFGHMHCDTVVHENFFAVFDDVMLVEKGEPHEELESLLLLNG